MPGMARLHLFDSLARLLNTFKSCLQPVLRVPVRCHVEPVANNSNHNKWSKNFDERPHRMSCDDSTIPLLLTQQQRLPVLFSGRELAFTFAICYRRSVCRLSVVCLSVSDVGAPYSGG